MRPLKNKKGYLEISFGWIFALIVGGIILFLAIFAVVKISKTESSSVDIQTAVSLGALTNPLETGVETGSSNKLDMNAESRIFIDCVSTGDFGSTKLRVNQKVFEKWTASKTDISLKNKYIFSKGLDEGTTFYFFTKSFEYPFKIASLTYLTSAADNYCFIGAPEEINDQLYSPPPEELSFEKNIRVKGSDKDCLANSTNICFSTRANCDIIVDYDIDTKSGIVQKEENQLSFTGEALMFAAIFSEKDLYECQLKRLAKRGSELASIYDEKAALKNCGGNIGLSGLQNSFNEVANNARDLNSLSFEVNDIYEKNDNSDCRLW